MARNPFQGVIKLDVRDCKPDWGPYTLAEAPDDFFGGEAAAWVRT